MAPLSDGLPEAAKREYLLKELRPGCVLRLHMQFPDKAKPKFLVLVADDESDYWTFFINSEIHPFVQARPHLRQCQVTVDAANHLFLDYDSNLACHEVKKVRKDEVLRILMQDASGLRGHISPATREQVVAAVKFAHTLSAKEKEQILDALE